MRLGGVVVSKSLIRMEFISLTFIVYKILHVVNGKARGETVPGKRCGEVASPRLLGLLEAVRVLCSEFVAKDAVSLI